MQNVIVQILKLKYYCKYFSGSKFNIYKASWCKASSTEMPL